MSLDEYVNKDFNNRKRYIFKHLVASIISEYGNLNGDIQLNLTREDFKYIMLLVRDDYVFKHDIVKSKQYELNGTKYNFKTTSWGLTNKGREIAIKNMNREGAVI